MGRSVQQDIRRREHFLGVYMKGLKRERTVESEQFTTRSEDSLDFSHHGLLPVALTSKNITGFLTANWCNSSREASGGGR